MTRFSDVNAFDEIRRDLRHTLRSCARNPGFAAVVVLTLGVGIGATTAVFSVVNAVVLRPLKAPHADRLVRSLSVNSGRSTEVPSPYTLKVWNGLSDVFEDVSAHRLDSVPLIGSSQPEQISVGRVSEAFFRLFGAPLVAGRTFTVDEDRPNGPAVAVLSSELWIRRFGGDPEIVGRTVSLGSVPHTVVGIIGPGFDSEQFEPRPALWLPLQTDPDHVDGASIYQVTARLRPGVTPAAADAALAVEYARLNRPTDRAAAERVRQGRWIAEPLQTAMVGSARVSLNVLLGAVAFLLLIACANVASLLLVRADVRKREMAIRSAIGAGGGRLVRQLLVESLVLCLIAGVVGLGVGVLGTQALLRLYPSSNPFMLGALGAIPRIGEFGAAVTVDWRVLGFALLVSLGTGIVFGLVPSRHLRGSELNPLLHASLASGAAGRRLNARAIFVIVEVALAVILVVGATLLILTSVALRRVDPGFNAEHVLTMRMAVTGTRFDTRAGISELARAGVDRVQAIPGVIRASTMCCMPLETVWQLPFVIASRAGEGLAEAGRMRFHGFGGWTFVSPGYFEVLGIPILKGRDFTFEDDANAPGVVIINEAMARRFWPKGDPLNDQLIIGRGMRPAYDEEPVRQIVGIVGNVRDTGLRDAARPAMYVPMAQEPDGVTVANVKLLPLVWIARTATEPHRLSGSIKSALESSVGQLPVTRIQALTDVVSDSTARTRFNTWLMTVFGFCALALAGVGVYGLVSYWVQQRSREIGVRLALGAEASRIAMMVVGQGMRLALLGVGVGLVGALALAQAIRGLLFGVPAHDPIVFTSIALLLAVVALAAVSIPAWKASRIDPLRALRTE
jgi:putative ABC transport system permease protein